MLIHDVACMSYVCALTIRRNALIYDHLGPRHDNAWTGCHVARVGAHIRRRATWVRHDTVMCVMCVCRWARCAARVRGHDAAFCDARAGNVWGPDMTLTGRARHTAVRLPSTHVGQPAPQRGSLIRDFRVNSEAQGCFLALAEHVEATRRTRRRKTGCSYFLSFPIEK